MKYYKPLAWMMAIAIASTTMTACSSDDNETEKPFTTDPVESSMLYACGVGQSETRSVADAQNEASLKRAQLLMRRMCSSLRMTSNGSM